MAFSSGNKHDRRTDKGLKVTINKTDFVVLDRAAQRPSRRSFSW